MPADMKTELAPAPLYTQDQRAFIDSLNNFFFETFFTIEHSQLPHRLQYETSKERKYLNYFFHDASRVIKATYTRGKMLPDVEALISSKGPELHAAFETLLQAIMRFDSRIAATRSRAPGRGVDVTQEEHGLNGDDFTVFDQAVEKIWAAYPQLDPRVLEGQDYTMSSADADFRHKLSSHWVFARNSHRSDNVIVAKLLDPSLATPWDPVPPPEKSAAILKQTAENMLRLRPHAFNIGAFNLAWYLKKICVLDASYDTHENSLPLAQTILKDLLKNPASLRDTIEKIQSGAFAPLQGERKWTKDDEIRQAVKQDTGLAADFVGYAMHVGSGNWFYWEHQKLLELAERFAPDAAATQFRTAIPKP